jgi:hypothetical protein
MREYALKQEIVHVSGQVRAPISDRVLVLVLVRVQECGEPVELSVTKAVVIIIIVALGLGWLPV